MTRFVLATVLLMLAAPAVAQEVVGKPPTEQDLWTEDDNPEANTEPAKPPTEADIETAGTKLLDSAIAAKAQGRDGQAAHRLDLFLSAYPDHRRANEALKLRDAWSEQAAAEVLAERAKREQRLDRSSGRAWLSAGQALHGFGLGVEIWLLASEPGQTNTTPGVGFGAGLAGLAVGAGAAVALTPNGIERGHASALNSGPIWGFALAFTSARANYALGRGKARIVTSMLGQFAGLGAGELVWRLFEPTAGQVWVADTAALWGMVLGTTLLASVRDPFPPRRPIVAGTHFFAIAFGLAGGGALAATSPNITVTDLLLINGGGLLGLVAGAFVGLGTTDGDPEPVALGATVGGVTGLTLAALLSKTARKKRKPKRDLFLSLGLTPLEDGGQALTVGGRF